MKRAEDVAEELVSLITQALADFAEGRVKDAGRNSGQDAKDHYLEGKADGRAEALEEAAKVAECHITNDTRRGVEVGYEKAVSEIAGNIRALKEKA